MIHLGKAADGRLVMGCNHKLPDQVKRVEYYRDQRLFMLIFQNEEDQLMPCEMAGDIADIIQKSPNIVVIVKAEEDKEPMGYEVPLVQIGI